jgi:uncharacterized membrane protein
MVKFSIDTRYIGIALIIVGIAIAVIMYNFSTTMINLIDTGQVTGSCMSYETCPHVAVINQAYFGYVLSAVIMVIGAFLLVFGGKPEKSEPNESEKKKSWDEKLRTLTGDERTVYEKITASGGVMFQSDLVDKSGFPKAKVSRILDRMEASGLIERKRRGMANAIVLK